MMSVMSSPLILGLGLLVLSAVLLQRVIKRLLRRWQRANGADWGNRAVNRVDGWIRLHCTRYHRLDYQPIALPESGPAIVVSNHISGLDALILITACRRPLRFLIAKEQYHRFGLNWLYRAAGCIPVDRRGRPEQAFRAAVKALAAGEVVAVFPHGTIDGHQSPRRIKAGACKLASLAGCPIYPAYISGVKGAGHTLLALPLRSRARLENFAPIYCRADETKACTGTLQALLNGPAGARASDSARPAS